MYKRFLCAKNGFTLPAVLITSLVMLATLLMALQLSLNASNSLNEIRYGILARSAAEAGSEHMQDCIHRGFFVDGATIKPSTNCNASTVSGAQPYILNSTNERTTYEATYSLGAGGVKQATIVGIMEKVNPAGGVVFSRSYTMRQQVEPEADIAGMRATRRWWYFGRAILDFGVSGNQTPIVSAGTGSAGGEGVTVITNRSGVLQFYSNGLTVWNRNGEVMANAGDLKGSNTATQAVVAFPINADETRYAVVSNTANHANVLVRGTLYYSIVDMTKQGGLGEVIIKNQVIPGSQSASSEALVAASNLAGDGFWVYTYNPNPNNNRVLGFELKKSGGSVAVTRSTSREITVNKIQTRTSGVYTEVYDFGTINFSPDYSKMIVYMGGGTTGPAYTGALHLFDVDLVTGEVSNDVTWLSGTSNSNPDMPNRGYSADFSPSGRYIYSTQLYPGRLYRYDISSGNATTIKNSEQYVGFTNCTYPGQSCDAYLPPSAPIDNQGGGQVLRGPDGKMYVASNSSSAISVIDRPDATALSGIGWRYNGLKLPSGVYSYYGLPQMVTIYSSRITSY